MRSTNKAGSMSGARTVDAQQHGSPVVDIAREDGEGVNVVRDAYNFAIHVNAIAVVARGCTQDNSRWQAPHLTPKNIALISKLDETGIRTALAKAAASLHPLAPKPPADLPVDHIPWHFDLMRLHKATSFLQRVRHVVASQSHLRARDLDDLTVHTTAVRVNVDALRLVLGRGKFGSQSSEVFPKSGDRANVVKLVKQARGLVEAVTGDLLRASHTRSTLWKPVTPTWSIRNAQVMHSGKTNLPGLQGERRKLRRGGCA